MYAVMMLRCVSTHTVAVFFRGWFALKRYISHLNYQKNMFHHAFNFIYTKYSYQWKVKWENPRPEFLKTGT